MEAEGIAQSAISAFESTFNSLVSGNTGIIPESTISPVPELVHTDSITAAPDTSLLASTVVLKLNGGLGTGMGLDKAKSLLEVKNGDTFLDLTAKQVICMREEFGQKVKFMLMNSFSTSEDTLEFFRTKYPSLAAEEGLEMLQNKVPKLDATTYEVSQEFIELVYLYYIGPVIFIHKLILCRKTTAWNLSIRPKQRMVPTWPRRSLRSPHRLRFPSSPPRGRIQVHVRL
jgi:hypothetical protein